MAETITVMPSEEWLTTEQTMQLTRKALRTVQELAKSGKLRWKLRHRPGTKPERLYDAQDVQALVPPEPAPRERLAVTEREPKRVRAPRPAQQQLALVPDAHAPQLIAALEKLAAPKPVDVVQKLWLSLDEAAEYSGLARTTLLDLIGKGKLLALKSGGWKIQRKSLEAFKG